MLSELPIHKLEKRVDGLNFLRGVLGPRSVGFKKGGDAKERRQILHDLFTQQSLNQLMPAFCETIVTSVAAWSDHPSPLEAQGKARRLWMDLNALNVFGTGQDTVELCEKFSEALGLLLEARFGPPIVPLTKRWWNLQRALNELHAGEGERWMPGLTGARRHKKDRRRRGRGMRWAKRTCTDCVWGLIQVWTVSSRPTYSTGEITRERAKPRTC